MLKFKMNNWFLITNIICLCYIVLLVLNSYYPLNSNLFDFLFNLITIPIIGYILFSSIFSLIKLINKDSNYSKPFFISLICVLVMIFFTIIQM